MSCRELTPCRPDEVASLLPEVLAGRMVLAPLAEPSLAGKLRPELGVDEVDAGLVVTTSGSSGTPKQVVLSTAALTAAAESAQTVTGPLVWTNVLPTHYVAGAMVLVRALVAGTLVRHGSSRLDDLEPDPARANAISIVPTQLFRVLDDPALVASLARYDLVLLGGAAVDEGLLARAREQGLRLVTTYGMSETCGGCVWDGVPLPGVRVDIGPDQRISLAGPMAFSGYRGQPALTAEVLHGDRVRTNDRGSWDEGRLSVLGRLDEVVISGGVNVDLASVQRAVDGLCAAHSLAPAVVVGLPDDEWGQRVTLVQTGEAPALSWWQEQLREELAAAALPRRLERVAELPTTSSGKIDRRAIVARLA